MSNASEEKKTSVGGRIVQRLGEFTEALKSKKVISEHFTCHRVVSDLQPTPDDPEMVRKYRAIPSPPETEP